MKKVLLLMVCFLSGSANAALIELINNGSFESGTFSGWSTRNLGAGGCGQNIWEVLTDGRHECADNGVTAVAPVHGQYAAYNTFDGPAGTLRLSQLVLLPEEFEGLYLSWIQTVDMNGNGAPRTVSVNFLTSGGSLIGNVYSQSFANGAFNRWASAGRNAFSLLSAYAGEYVRLEFSNIIPTSFTGAGGYGVDNISLRASIVEEQQEPETPDAPEPAPIALLALGLAVVGWMRKKSA